MKGERLEKDRFDMYEIEGVKRRKGWLDALGVLLRGMLAHFPIVMVFSFYK